MSGGYSSSGAAGIDLPTLERWCQLTPEGADGVVRYGGGSIVGGKERGKEEESGFGGKEKDDGKKGKISHNSVKRR